MFIMIIKKMSVLSIIFITIQLGDFSYAFEEKSFIENIETDVTVGKDYFVFGEPIFIKINIRNNSEKTIYLNDRLEIGFKFSDTNISNQSVNKMPEPAFISGFIQMYEVKSQKDYNDIIYLNNFFDFNKPGSYEIDYKGKIPISQSSIPSNLSENIIDVSGILLIEIRKSSTTEVGKIINDYIKDLKNNENKIRSRASQGLSLFESNLVVNPIKQMLISEVDSIILYSSNASWVLAKIGTKQSKEALFEIAEKSKSPIVRRTAIREIGRWKFKESLPTLKILLNDPHALIKIEALKSIGEIGDEDSIPEVEKLLNDPDEKVKENALKVFEILTNKLIKEKLIKTVS